MIHSFSPAVNDQTRILIVGSMPGRASLAAQEYYAYPRNQFWRIMFDLLENGRAPKDYQDKINSLLRHQIGLWDALARCERQGSLDGNIERPVPNDFPTLFQRYPHIHTLLFNGQAAARHFKQAFGKTVTQTLCVLPSTSPAHAALSYSEKLHQWETALTQARRNSPL